MATADIVITVHDLERSLAEGAWILDGDQHAINQPAGRQRSASKIGGCATTRQHGSDKERASGAQPKTAFLQNPLPRRNRMNAVKMLKASEKRYFHAGSSYAFDSRSITKQPGFSGL